MVVRTHRDCGSRACRAMKQKDHSRDLVQLNEVRAFAAELTRAEEVATARRECTAAARNVKSVESVKAELLVEKIVGLLL